MLVRWIALPVSPLYAFFNSVINTTNSLAFSLFSANTLALLQGFVYQSIIIFSINSLLIVSGLIYEMPHSQHLLDPYKFQTKNYVQQTSDLHPQAGFLQTLPFGR